jgi:hypothetical protein
MIEEIDTTLFLAVIAWAQKDARSEQDFRLPVPV